MAVVDCSWIICSNTFDHRFVAAIQSCLSQEARGKEVIVVCNGRESRDVAENVRRAFGQVPSVIVLETRISQLIFSLNFGIHHAQGRYVARMDADDLAYPARLRLQVDFMEAHPDVAVCGMDYDFIDDDDRVIRRVSVAHEDRTIRSQLTWSNPFCHPTTMIRKDVLLETGGYSGGVFAEDYDLWVRMSLVPRLRFANLPFVGIGYRASPQGMARRSRLAYASVAGTQFRCFANGGGWRWGAAAAVTALKGCLRATRK